MIARWWCRRRKYHRWLMGRSHSDFLFTPDICLTCHTKTTWPPRKGTR